MVLFKECFLMAFSITAYVVTFVSAKKLFAIVGGGGEQNGPNFVDPKLAQPKSFQTELTRRNPHVLDCGSLPESYLEILLVNMFGYPKQSCFLYCMTFQIMLWILGLKEILHKYTPA